MDYALDTTIWGLTVSGSRVTEVSDGIEEMIQRICIALKTHLGEKMLDTTLGLDYAGEILIKNPNLEQIASTARTYLATRVEGVVGVRKLEITLDAETRTQTWALDVETESGITGPFALSVP